ncbi:hypothetical protein RJ639_046311 [Escallonia herrerae]|uniref:FAD-binding PCMH-type domain-containing protein n=1 Tax=Escallonia herrerae TaxID=1293975 RepID=A0AA88W6L1_9ASTE|nr:hypothetical protein RJ639_046311 [Escallonia herrerae]
MRAYHTSAKPPFIIIDLVNLQSIHIKVDDETAWVQSGATLGELYYSIAKKSGIHGFPAGICPSVGIGGHFSGGGFGTMVRKYGLAADNVIDACLVDVNGSILDRETMGEDLFWAIRGGGGASFGVIVSWKIKLVRVPPVVSVFNIDKKLDQRTTELVHRWQYVAQQLHKDLFIRLVIQDVNEVTKGQKKTLQVSFNSLFLGTADELLSLMHNRFPELGLQAETCTEMSWIESVLYFAGYPRGQSLDVLLNRTVQYKNGVRASNRHIHWMRMLYSYMKQYVSHSPRAAYLNYRDLDLGTNQQANTSNLKAKVWGKKYFKGNFKV